MREKKMRGRIETQEEHLSVAVKPAHQDRSTVILLLIAAMVAIGGISFAVGRVTAGGGTGTSNTGTTGRGFPGGGRNFSFAPGQSFDPGQFGGRGIGGGGAVTGTVVSVSGTSMTVKLANGSTVTIDLSGTTTYHSQTAATSSDVQPGATVQVTIDVSGLAGPSGAPAPSASGIRSVSAKDVLIETP